MKNLAVIAIPVAVALTGCATASFTAGMKEPIKAVKNSTALVDQAEHDVLMAVATGIASSSSPIEEIVCKPAGDGPENVRTSLQEFSDALDTVQKVGEKPEDTTYSGYIRKFRKNAAAGSATVGTKAERDEARRKELARCKALFKDDTAASTQMKPLDKDKDKALPIAAQLLALDQLLKALLAQGELASREMAVRRTIQHFIPRLESAAKQLEEGPMSAYGPVVQYEPGSTSEAATMNSGALGAAINIRRWYVAQQVKNQWAFLSRCRSAADKTCFGDPVIQSAANGFANSVYAYRSLAQVNPIEIQKALKTAIAAAKTSLEVKDVATWIDGLIGVADALSALDEAYKDYEKSKE